MVRLYREWRFSGDDDFLREVWPGARRALEFAFTTWDSDGDFVLDSQQHNTYDIEFYGENMLANSIFFAALRAGARLAEHLGETELAGRWLEAAELGAARADAVLYNGEYYRQRTDDVDAHRYQYGEGCLSDQLLGQTYAHLNGLGHLLPPDHVRSAVGAIFEHNFRRDFSDYHSVQRTYALNDDQGLVLCTWPRGGRPRIPFVYSDEVWSGIEYQVATNLIYDGLVERGPGGGPRGPGPARRCPPQPVERGGVRQPLRPVAGQLGSADRPDRCAVGRERPEPVDRAPGGGAAGRRAALLLQHRDRLGRRCRWRTAGRRCGSSAARSTWPRRRSSIPSSAGSGCRPRPAHRRTRRSS